MNGRATQPLQKMVKKGSNLIIFCRKQPLMPDGQTCCLMIGALTRLAFIRIRPHTVEARQQIQWNVTQSDFHIHLFADFSPSLLQTVDGATVEGRRDLQDPVVVVETAADVRHSHPLLDGAGPGAHVGVGHNLWGHQVAHLDKGKRREGMRGCSGQSPGGVQRLEASLGRTSLKCWLVFMMYGVRSILSTFIHPCPRNSLPEGAQTHLVSLKVITFNISHRKCGFGRSIYWVFEVYWTLPAHKNEL